MTCIKFYRKFVPIFRALRYTECKKNNKNRRKLVFFSSTCSSYLQHYSLFRCQITFPCRGHTCHIDTSQLLFILRINTRLYIDVKISFFGHRPYYTVPKCKKRENILGLYHDVNYKEGGLDVRVTRCERVMVNILACKHLYYTKMD